MDKANAGSEETEDGLAQKQKEKQKQKQLDKI